MSYVDTVFAIESRKYDQSLHRRWEENTVLYQNEFFIVGFNDRTNVTEQNKPIWQTTEPAIFYFDRRYWFNIIFILTEAAFYYCNLSSPRSEEHTSELQSRGHLVCRLLLEKK